MFKLMVICCALLAAPSALSATEFTRQVSSGKKALMRAYSNFNLSDCSAYKGTVTVVEKPRYGTLSTTTGPYKIDINRFTGQRSKCAGKTISGLNVLYVSQRGFRGTDTFTLRATYREGMLSATDRYTVEVR
ncbi:hypothetical protein RPB_1188 [Rhodopseudomonas palustris HaA2]|uniref:Uncharacterized protein n=1 Tax=Rhodopseudomonas palustris (strain HaA2) TaxID=316058 RepID=Q2J0W2_RHOP2|nr:hypothetical protein [Rhodopseudomonas palustris]ABD05898.1 hypothetical protein RPB_1188 [Rhodopseudomonas palustris HaA2]